MEVEFSGEVFVWRGPSPHHFVAVPADDCTLLAEAAAALSYGWGMLPVTARIGTTEWTTSLWPREGGYVVPLKAAVRRAEGLEVGGRTRVRLRLVL